MSQLNRVVITGLGMVAANGVGADAFWASLASGKSGVREITQFDASEFPISIAGEVTDFNVQDFAGREVKPRRMARHTQFALACTHMALKQAGIEPRSLTPKSPLAIIVGISTSAFDVIEKGKERMQSGGFHRVSAYFVESSQPHGVATVLARNLGVQARCQTISSACASGLEAIAAGTALIRHKHADVVIVGGADATITPLALASFVTAGLLPENNGDPARASRPFDRQRKGGILGEGAAMLVLESRAHALARGGRPLAEILGHGSIIDGPNGPPCCGMADAMRLAIDNAGRHAGEIQYICAHGPSDPILDAVETRAIRQILADRADDVPVSSIKGVTANPLAAAGPLEVAACVMAMTRETIPPTANYEEPDPECDLDYVQTARSCQFDQALVNVHGMGGINSSLYLQRCQTP